MMHDSPTAAPGSDLLDVERVARIARGERAALRELYEAHGGRVFAFSRRMLGDAHEAEEATQDVFVRVWRRAGDFDPSRASPWAWMVVMTRSVCLDRLRRRRRRPDMAASFLSTEPDEADGSIPATQRPDAVDMHAAGQEVSTLLQLLKPAERTCVAHVFFDGLTQAETATRTGMPLGTVKTHLRRGLLRLRQFLSRHDS